MFYTIKELAQRLHQEEILIRQLVSLFGIQVRGEGIKPARGRTAATYKEEDLIRALEIVATAKEQFSK